jgi:hypothetical protein
MGIQNSTKKQKILYARVESTCTQFIYRNLCQPGQTQQLISTAPEKMQIT